MTKKIENLEDLEVWQNAISLSVDIYSKFGICKDFSLKDQICRASVSIPSNIAEGFERHYNNFCLLPKVQQARFAHNY